jgi:hypothetical protein
MMGKYIVDRGKRQVRAVFPIQDPVSAYTFPSDARTHQVGFDDEYSHADRIDGRRMSIPPWWIRTLYSAPREELEKYEITARGP